MAQVLLVVLLAWQEDRESSASSDYFCSYHCKAFLTFIIGDMTAEVAGSRVKKKKKKKVARP